MGSRKCRLHVSLRLVNRPLRNEKVKMILEKESGFFEKLIPSWSRLSVLGGTPVFKLTLLSPLLAQVLLHHEEFEFLSSLRIDNVVCLYWTLITIFVGQLFYTFFCPDNIKQYPEKNMYIGALNSTFTEDEIQEVFFHIYKLHFRRHGGKLNAETFGDFYSLKDYENKNYLQLVEDIAAHINRVGATDEAFKIAEEIRVALAAVKYDSPHSVDWKLISEHFPRIEHFLGDGDTSPVTSSFSNFSLDIRRWMLKSHSRQKLLNYRFKSENKKKLIVRCLISVAYFAGIGYFVFFGGKNIVCVFNETLGSGMQSLEFCQIKLALN